MRRFDEAEQGTQQVTTKMRRLWSCSIGADPGVVGRYWGQLVRITPAAAAADPCRSMPVHAAAAAAAAAAAGP